MTHILDQVAAGNRQFHPETAREFFALQLARKLNDIANSRIYAALVESVTEDVLVSAFHHAESQKDVAETQAFQAELRRLTRKHGL